MRPFSFKVGKCAFSAKIIEPGLKELFWKLWSSFLFFPTNTVWVYALTTILENSFILIYPKRSIEMEDTKDLFKDNLAFFYKEIKFK